MGVNNDWCLNVSLMPSVSYSRLIQVLLLITCACPALLSKRCVPAFRDMDSFRKYLPPLFSALCSSSTDLELGLEKVYNQLRSHISSFIRHSTHPCFWSHLAMNHLILLSLSFLFAPTSVYSESNNNNGNKTRRDDESNGDLSNGDSPPSIPAIPMFSPLSFPPPGLFGQLPPPQSPHPAALGPIPAASGFTAFYRPLPPPPQPPVPLMAPRMSYPPHHMPFLPPPTMMPLMVQPLKRWDESGLFDSLLHSESHLEPFGLLDDPIELEEEDLLAHRRPSPPPPPPPPSSAHRRESFNPDHHHHHHHHHHNNNNRNHYRQALHEPERHRSDPYEPIGMENRFDRPPVESRSYRGDYADDARDGRDHREGGNVPPVDDRADRYGPSNHYDRHGIDHHPHSRIQHSSSSNSAPPPPSNGDYVEKK